MAETSRANNLMTEWERERERKHTPPSAFSPTPVRIVSNKVFTGKRVLDPTVCVSCLSSLSLPSLDFLQTFLFTSELSKIQFYGKRMFLFQFSTSKMTRRRHPQWPLTLLGPSRTSRPSQLSSGFFFACCSEVKPCFSLSPPSLNSLLVLNLLFDSGFHSNSVTDLLSHKTIFCTRKIKTFLKFILNGIMFFLQ